MSQIHAPISCSHSILDHLLHPLCPAQSDLRKVANIIIPLFIILGAIYYARKHFNPFRMMEITIENLIAKGEYTQARNLVDQLPHGDKRSAFYDKLDEIDCRQLLKSNELSKAEGKALSIISDEIRNPLLEEIFNAYLPKDGPAQNMNKAQSLIRRFRNEAKCEEIRDRFVTVALKENKNDAALDETLQLTSKEARTRSFDLLIPYITENIEAKRNDQLVEFEKKLGSKNVEEIIELMINKEKWFPALTMTICLADQDKKVQFRKIILEASVKKENLLDVYERVDNFSDGSVSLMKQLIEVVQDEKLFREKIFKASLEKGKLGQACSVIQRFESLHASLMPQLIEAALSQKNGVTAVYAYYYIIDEAIRVRFFDRLLSNIVENPTPLISDSGLPDGGWMDAVYQKGVEMLLGKNELSHARGLARHINTSKIRDQCAQDVFKRFFAEGKLQEAGGMVLSIFDKGKSDELNRELIDAAIKKEMWVLAAAQAVSFATESEMMGIFDKVAPKMAEEPAGVVKYVSTAVRGGRLNKLLEKIIPLLMDKKDFVNAETLANAIVGKTTKDLWLEKIKIAKAGV